jgi:putative endonuclease
MTGKGGYIYIISNKNRTVLYIGVTSDLYYRISQHKEFKGSIFAKKYNCVDLLYYKFYETIEIAIDREKQLKKWKRAWKDELIIKFNPGLKDLYSEVEDFR